MIQSDTESSVDTEFRFMALVCQVVSLSRVGMTVIGIYNIGIAFKRRKKKQVDPRSVEKGYVQYNNLFRSCILI